MHENYGYKIGEFEFSLDDIETGILRCNRPHWAQSKKNKIMFENGDEREKLSLKEPVDPRIFFAINCGGKGGASIEVYYPVSIVAQFARWR